MDILKKTLQFGFGLAYIGKEHLDVLMKELIDKYDLDATQSKKLAKDIIAHSLESNKKIKELLEKHIKDFFKDADKIVKKPTKKPAKKEKPKKRVNKKKATKTTKRKSIKKKVIKKKK